MGERSPDMVAEFHVSGTPDEDAVAAGEDVMVLGPGTERICYVPAARAPWIAEKRTNDERWLLASRIARLLCEDAADKRRAAKAEPTDLPLCGV